jgi:regulator of protease activity HflC (stomatin/prohibitin superfamily)
MARALVQEFERAVVHRSGAPGVVFGPGRHRYRRFRTALVLVDLRPALLKVAGQEVLTADGVGVRASVVVRYSVTDPLRWVLAGDAKTGGAEWLYLAAQLAVRDFVSGLSVEDLLHARSVAGETLLLPVRETAERVGAVVEAVDLRDLSFPGDLKRTSLRWRSRARRPPRPWNGRGARRRHCAPLRTRHASSRVTRAFGSCVPCWRSSEPGGPSC